MFNTFYDNMKPKFQKELNGQIHFFNLLNSLIGMFTWKNLPDTIRPEMLESILCSEGTVGAAKYDDGIYVGPGGYCGKVIAGIPQDYQITVTGKGSKRGKVGETFAVCWNNNTATPDMDLMKTASILSEIDVSERLNVIFARLLRIPKVKDQKDKAAVEAAIKAILNGNIEAVVSSNVQDEIFENEDSTQFFDLVDIKDIDKLQYLAGYRDEIMKRWFELYGQDIHTNSKRAQQSVEEITGSSAMCMIIPNIKLAQRKRFCEQYNKLFDANIDVEFSECWQDTMADLTNPEEAAETEEKGAEDNAESNDENSGDSGDS